MGMIVDGSWNSSSCLTTNSPALSSTIISFLTGAKLYKTETDNAVGQKCEIFLSLLFSSRLTSKTSLAAFKLPFKTLNIQTGQPRRAAMDAAIILKMHAKLLYNNRFPKVCSRF